MKQFKDLKPLEQICIFIAVIFATVLITMHLGKPERKVNTNTATYTMPLDELQLKLRGKYVELDNGQWLWCVRVVSEDTFTWSDNYANFGHAPIARIIAVSDINEAHK